MANQKQTNQVKEVNKMTEYKFTAPAYQTKDNKKFLFKINGHKYMLSEVSAKDYMYSGIRSDYKITEIIETKE